MSPSLSPCLSPNLVLNDPFPLFSRPIFYRLDQAQYGGALYADERRGGKSSAREQPSPNFCRHRRRTCQSGKNFATVAANYGTKGRTFSWIRCQFLGGFFPLTLTGETDLTFCNGAEPQQSRRGGRAMCLTTQLCSRK